MTPIAYRRRSLSDIDGGPATTTTRRSYPCLRCNRRHVSLLVSLRVRAHVVLLTDALAHAQAVRLNLHGVVARVANAEVWRLAHPLVERSRLTRNSPRCMGQIAEIRKTNRRDSQNKSPRSTMTSRACTIGPNPCSWCGLPAAPFLGASLCFGFGCLCPPCISDLESILSVETPPGLYVCCEETDVVAW